MKLRIGSTEVGLGFTFFVMLSLFLYFDFQGMGAAMVTALLLHEMGHMAAILLLRVPIQSINLSCFGVDIVRGQTTSLSYGREAMIYLGGPISNLIIGGLLAVWNQGWNTATAIHLVMGCFQLLPVGALDGGQCVSLMLKKHSDRINPQFWSILISAAALIPLFWMSARILRGENRNISLLVTCVYLTFSVLMERRRT